LRIILIALDDFVKDVYSGHFKQCFIDIFGIIKFQPQSFSFTSLVYGSGAEKERMVQRKKWNPGVETETETTFNGIKLNSIYIISCGRDF
jgi:hypothetical protein